MTDAAHATRSGITHAHGVIYTVHVSATALPIFDAVRAQEVDAALAETRAKAETGLDEVLDELNEELHREHLNLPVAKTAADGGEEGDK